MPFPPQLQARKLLRFGRKVKVLQRPKNPFAKLPLFTPIHLGCRFRKQLDDLPTPPKRGEGGFLPL